MNKYKITFDNGDTETVHAWKMELDNGMLTFYDDTGEMTSLFMSVKSVKKESDRSSD